MGTMFVVFCLLSQVYVLQSYTATESSEITGRPTNLLATSNSDVVVSIGNSLYLYNSTLYPLRNFTSERTRAAANISRVIVADGDSLLVCFYDGSCDFLIAANDYYPILISNVATSRTMISLSVIEETFYIASAGYNNERTAPIRLSQFENHFMYFTNDALSVTMRITNANFRSREFYHNYFHDGYVYFIAMDTFTSQERKIMLVRICHQVNESNLHDMFEIELSCGPLPLDMNDHIASFTKLNETVVLGLSNTAGRNRFCAFNTSEVNRGITEIYDHCLNGSYQFQLPWHHVNSTCTNFNKVISQHAVALLLF